MNLSSLELGAEHFLQWLERVTTDKKLEADDEFGVATLELMRTRLQPIIASPEAQQWFSKLDAMIAANTPPSQPASPSADPQPSKPTVIMTPGGAFRDTSGGATG